MLNLSETPDGIRISVKLTPKSSKNQILGVEADALKVSVTSPPEDGKANAALIELLAKSFKIAKSRITLVTGGKNRHKTLAISGDSQELFALIIEWIAQNGQNNRR